MFFSVFYGNFLESPRVLFLDRSLLRVIDLQSDLRKKGEIFVFWKSWMS